MTTTAPVAKKMVEIPKHSHLMPLCSCCHAFLLDHAIRAMAKKNSPNPHDAAPCPRELDSEPIENCQSSKHLHYIISTDQFWHVDATPCCCGVHVCILRDSGTCMITYRVCVCDSVAMFKQLELGRMQQKERETERTPTPASDAYSTTPAMMWSTPTHKFRIAMQKILRTVCSKHAVSYISVLGDETNVVRLKNGLHFGIVVRLW